MKFTFEEILKAMAAGKEIDIKDKTISKEDGYVNLTAATLLLSNNIDPVTKYNGKRLSKAVSDFTGANDYLARLTTFNRNDLITGAKAKEVLELIFDKTAFLSRVTTKTGDELTYPVDIWAVTKENLISTERAGTQPDSVSAKAGKIGKECFARHFEYQHDLKMISILNNLYNPSFDSELEDRIAVEIGNDILRLLTNGVADDYSSVAAGTMTSKNMYSLGIGWIKLLQDLNGSWTNSNQQSIVIGKFGNKVTPNKVNIDATGDVSVYSEDFGSDNGGFVYSAASYNGGGIDIGGTNFNDSAIKQNIAVTPATKATVTFSISGNDANSDMQLQVLKSDGTVLTESAHYTDATDYDGKTLSFYSGDERYVSLKFIQAASASTATIDDLSITEHRADYDGQDIIDVLDNLVDVMPDDYKQGNNVFIMSNTDAVKYGRAKGADVKIVNGNPVGVNTEAREAYRVKGSIPAHEGYEVTTNPMMFDIGTTKTLGYGNIDLPGSIIFGNSKELWAYAMNKVEKYREYKPRLSDGGAGFELGQHYWMDAQVGNCEAMCVAFQGASVESPVLMQNASIKSTECVSGTTTAANGLVPYCDTKDARIFAAKTASVTALADIDTAIDNAAAHELTKGESFTSSSDLTAASWSFIAFKDGYLNKSSIVQCTFA